MSQRAARPRDSSGASAWACATRARAASVAGDLRRVVGARSPASPSSTGRRRRTLGQTLGPPRGRGASLAACPTSWGRRGNAVDTPARRSRGLHEDASRGRCRGAAVRTQGRGLHPDEAGAIVGDWSCAGHLRPALEPLASRAPRACDAAVCWRPCSPAADTNPPPARTHALARPLIEHPSEKRPALGVLRTYIAPAFGLSWPPAAEASAPQMLDFGGCWRRLGHPVTAEVAGSSPVAPVIVSPAFPVAAGCAIYSSSDE
jgi:hypothetical protein